MAVLPPIFLQTVLLLSILQWFNLIIYLLNTYRLNDYNDTMCSIWDMNENVIFSNDCLNMRIQQKIKVESLLKWLILFFTPQIIGINTKIILISCIVTEIMTKARFSVVAALICILRGLPKDDRVASFKFFKSTLQRYGNSKKILYGRYCKVIGPCHLTNSRKNEIKLREYLTEHWLITWRLLLSRLSIVLWPNLCWWCALRQKWPTYGTCVKSDALVNLQWHTASLWTKSTSRT